MITRFLLLILLPLVYGQCGLDTIGPAAQLTMSNTEYYVQTAKGVNTGNEVVTIYGMADTAAALNTLYWLELRTAPAAAFIIPTSSAQVSLISTSTADISPAGNGCRTVEVKGTDATGAALTSTVTMNGNTATALTAGTYSFINSLTCLTVGTTLRNEGTITVSAGPGIAANRPTISLTTSSGTPNIGVGRSLNAAYRVPTGKNLLITGITANAYRNAASAATFGGSVLVMYSTSATGPQLLLQRIGLDADASSGVSLSLAEAPLRLPAGSVVWANFIWQVIPMSTSVTITGVLY
jgi:hypothetical protein